MERPIKQTLMSTVDMRKEVATWLEELDDNFLAAVHAMVGTYVKKQDDSIVGYRVGTKEPILASEADEAFEAVVEDVKAGNYTEIDDLLKERSERW